MTRKVWFQLVDGEGEAIALTDCVDCVDDAKVFRLRDAVKDKNKDSLLAGILAAKLTVFENREKYYGEKPLSSGSLIEAFGRSMNEALIVVVPDVDDEDEGCDFIRLQAIYHSLLQYFIPSSRSLEKTKKDV